MAQANLSQIAERIKEKRLTKHAANASYGMKFGNLSKPVSTASKKNVADGKGGGNVTYQVPKTTSYGNVKKR